MLRHLLALNVLIMSIILFHRQGVALRTTTIRSRSLQSPFALPPALSTTSAPNCSSSSSPFPGPFPDYQKHKFLGGSQLSPTSQCKIYAIPSHSKSVLSITPKTSTNPLNVTRIPLPPTAVKNNNHNGGKFKWLRAITTPDERFIVGIPCWGNSILKIDTATDTVTTFGHTFLSTITPPTVKNWKYHGGQYSPLTGCMYAVPANALSVLKIDPVSEVVSEIGGTYEGKQKWYGGITGGVDGCIYGVPYGGCRVLVVNPNNDTVELIGDEGLLRCESEKGTVGYGWHGGVYSSISDCVYGFPAHGGGVLKVCCGTKAVSLVGEVGNREYKWLGGAEGGNGCVYGVPSDVDEVLKIDPRTDSVTTIQTPLLSGLKKNKFQGAALASDGCLYAIPSDSDFVLKINTSGEQEVITKIEGFSAPETKDKFQGAGVVEGKVYLIPENYHTPCVIHLETGIIEELF